MDFIANGIAWPLLAWGVAGVLILAGAVAVDARERGQSAALWFLLALLFPGVGALAYLVLRPPGEPAAFPAAVAAERPQAAPLSAAPVRGSVPAARDEPVTAPGTARDVPHPSAPPARDPSAPAAPREPARAEATAPGEPARAPVATESSRGGTMEWRRGVGVLAAATAPPPAAPSAPPARPEPQRGGGVPPWVLGAAAAVGLLVIGGVVGLPRLAPALGPHPPPPPPSPRPPLSPPPRRPRPQRRQPRRPPRPRRRPRARPPTPSRMATRWAGSPPSSIPLSRRS